MALHVERAGDGPDLVLLHGWGLHGGVWHGLARELAPGFRLHLVDLPGHGHSRALPFGPLDAVADAVAAVVPAGAAVCGWSLGGLVALHAAATRPARMPALAMVCATPRFVVGDDWPAGMPAQVFSSFADGLRSDWRGTIERFIALEAFGSDHMREELQMLRDAVLARGKPSPDVLAHGLEVLQASDLRAALPLLPMPSLWLAGRRDRLVNPEAMRASAGIAPRSRFVQVEHAGHAPFLTHAETVAAGLLGFLAEAGA